MCLLHFHSNHPLHVKESIVYTQALRYCWIISEDQNLDLELQTLAKTFLARKYPLSIIKRNLSKALSHTRESLLEDHIVENPMEVTPLVTPFTPVGQLVSRIVNQHWNIIEENEDLHQIWPERVTTAYKRLDNVKDHLVRTELRL